MSREILITRDAERNMVLEFKQDDSIVETFVCSLPDYAANIDTVGALHFIWLSGRSHAELRAWIHGRCQHGE